MHKYELVLWFQPPQFLAKLLYMDVVALYIGHMIIFGPCGANAEQH